MPSMQQEFSSAQTRMGSPQGPAPNMSKGLQQDLTQALSLALHQLGQLGRPSSKRGRLAQRRAQQFVESALETSQLLWADQQQSPEPMPDSTRDSASKTQSQHELLLNLHRQMSQSAQRLVQALPVLHVGTLPELPRIVSRTLSEVALQWVGAHADALSGLRLQAHSHGLSLQLLRKPMAEHQTQKIRAQLEQQLGQGTYTRLALVGAGIAPLHEQHSDVLISIVWPAQADDTH